MGFTFKKEERLCSRQLIDLLYEEGHKLMAFPYSVRYLVVDSDTSHPPCQVLIVVPKRIFHHAVDRNRIKRLTRECYRLRKGPFYQFLAEHDIHIVLSLVYIHNEMMTCEQLGHKMDKLMVSLEEDIIKMKKEK